MPTISNLTDRPVLLAFNSGQTLRLSPRSAAADIPDVEIINNAKVAKLASLNIITVEDPQRQRHAAGSTGAHAGRSSSRATDAAEASGRTTASERPEKSAKRPE